MAAAIKAEISIRSSFDPWPSDRCVSPRKRSPLALDASVAAARGAFAQHDTHEVGGVLGAQLLHDARAVHLDGARADAEDAARFLVGGAGRDLRQDLAFARGEELAPGKLHGEDVG